MILFLQPLNFLKSFLNLMPILVGFRLFYISLPAISNFFCDMVKIKIYESQSCKDENKRVLERIVYDNPSVNVDVNKANSVFRWLFGADAIISY